MNILTRQDSPRHSVRAGGIGAPAKLLLENRRATAVVELGIRDRGRPRRKCVRDRDGRQGEQSGLVGALNRRLLGDEDVAERLPFAVKRIWRVSSVH